MTDWMADALCKGYDGTNGRVDFLTLDPRVQRAVCHDCPVRFACLEYAIKIEAGQTKRDVAEYGEMYGGLTGTQRAELMGKAA